MAATTTAPTTGRTAGTAPATSPAGSPRAGSPSPRRRFLHRPPRSEVARGPDAEAVDPPLGHVLLAVPVREHVVELELHVRVQEPVQAERPVVHLAAPDGLVVQVEVAEAEPYLPRATAS